MFIYIFQEHSQEEEEGVEQLDILQEGLEQSQEEDHFHEGGEEEQQQQQEEEVSPTHMKCIKLDNL